MIEIAPPKQNEQIVITTKKAVVEPMPPYNLVGNGFRNRHGASLDIIDVCAQLNQGELKLLQFFRDAFNSACMRAEENPNLITPTKEDDFNDYLRVMLMKMYKHMEYVGLVIRVKRGVYILNPKLFMYSTGYTKILQQWEEARAKLDKETSNDAI